MSLFMHAHVYVFMMYHLLYVPPGRGYFHGYRCDKWAASPDGKFLYSGNNTLNHGLYSILTYNVVLIRDGYVLFRYHE
jgi:hypothetical protein